MAAMGGSASYAGYVRAMQAEDRDYDLAVFCYGHNDEPEDFAFCYEGLIRAVRRRFPRCALISILESAQGTYTDKMREIQFLADRYGILVADTIALFTGESGENSQVLANRVLHPSDAGHAVYAAVLETLIDGAVERGVPVDNRQIAPADPAVLWFDQFRAIDAEAFTRVGNAFRCTIDRREDVLLGIDTSFLPGENAYGVFLDGYQVSNRQFLFHWDEAQRHIQLVKTEPVAIDSRIEIRFAESAQADTFRGIYLSWKE